MSLKLNSAFSAASALVALESLTNSTRPSRPTCSMRWARPGKLAIARAISAPLTPSARAAAKAKAAFWPLWAPRNAGALSRPILITSLLAPQSDPQVRIRIQ